LPLIALFSGTFCNGEQFKQAIVQKTGFDYLSEEMFLSVVSERSGWSTQKLASAFSAKSSIFNKFTHEKERSMASIKRALAEFLRQNGKLLEGQTVFLIPGVITHVLKVCLIADVKTRIGKAMTERGLSEKESIKIVNHHDHELSKWLEAISDCHDPWASQWYDIIIPSDKTTPAHAADLINEHIKREILQPNTKSLAAVDDFELAARVEVALTEEGHDIRVSAAQGAVVLTINKNVLMLNRLEDELRGIVQNIAGVQSITISVGKDFHQADIYRKYDFALPSKVLLVDDEREFVQTLSERLQMRDMGSAVAYDGESALEIVSRDEPEVMILDLKMPGIDGIEVLKRVKSTRPEIEVIILTGHGSEADRETCMELGAFAYLQKPVDIEVLSQTLKQANEKIKKNKGTGAG